MLLLLLSDLLILVLGTISGKQLFFWFLYIKVVPDVFGITCLVITIYHSVWGTSVNHTYHVKGFLEVLNLLALFVMVGCTRIGADSKLICAFLKIKLSSN